MGIKEAVEAVRESDSMKGVSASRPPNRTDPEYKWFSSQLRVHILNCLLLGLFECS